MLLHSYRCLSYEMFQKPITTKLKSFMFSILKPSWTRTFTIIQLKHSYGCYLFGGNSIKNSL